MKSIRKARADAPGATPCRRNKIAPSPPDLRKVGVAVCRMCPSLTGQNSSVATCFCVVEIRLIELVFVCIFLTDVEMIMMSLFERDHQKHGNSPHENNKNS